KAQVEAGVDAIIVGGSLGESSTITLDERLVLLDSLKSGLPDLPVLINIAESATARAVQLAQRAEVAGADGLMLLPPMMYRATDTEVVNYFRDVAGNTNLPILVYNNPIDYKIEITPIMFDSLLKMKNIQAVKESTRDMANVTRLINRFGERLKVLTGVDTIAMESLMMGASGWVAGLVNAFPAETVALYQLVKAGRFDEAREIHRWFMPLLELDISPQLVQNIKLAESMTGMGTEYVRPPRMMLSGDERERIRQIIRRGIATRPALPEFPAR
ncbi:MAG TPA: dihydrodipicolinate synthase family protein, partial [Saprospiraceae bacterium]|nr:dihydrodipicolinate synthase family protein [Saprospiraceae bacterium]